MASDGRRGGPRRCSPAWARLNSIAAGIAARLADDGWNLGLSYWRPYDADLAPSSSAEEPERIAEDLRRRGATVVLLPSDLADPAVPDRLVADAAAALGPLRGLVLSHAESRDSEILDTTVESFDRHMIVNARASWQLIAAFARQVDGRWRHRRPHERRHDVQPPVRLVEGRARPHRHRRRPGARRTSGSGPTP